MFAIVFLLRYFFLFYHTLLLIINTLVTLPHNEAVNRGASKVHQLAAKYGMACRQLVWNPDYKWIDDWQLALHRKEQQNEKQ